MFKLRNRTGDVINCFRNGRAIQFVNFPAYAGGLLFRRILDHGTGGGVGAHDNYVARSECHLCRGKESLSIHFSFNIEYHRILLSQLSDTHDDGPSLIYLVSEGSLSGFELPVRRRQGCYVFIYRDSLYGWIIIWLSSCSGIQGIPSISETHSRFPSQLTKYVTVSRCSRFHGSWNTICNGCGWSLHGFSGAPTDSRLFFLFGI